jgi:hypothetical protein
MTNIDAPVNVRFERPTNPPPDWDSQARAWIDLNRTPVVINNALLYGNLNFYPLTIKAAYVIGVVHNICSSVSILLEDRSRWPETYVSAYGVFASAIDLLGRCLQGNTRHRAGITSDEPDLLAGYQWLRQPAYPDYTSIDRAEPFLRTNNGFYSIDALMMLRHYAAHGQGTTNRAVYEPRDIDYGILAQMPPLLATGLEVYWNLLMPAAPVTVSEQLCNRLARTDIIAFRPRPILRSWMLFQGDGDSNGRSITDIFSSFDWRLRR